MNGTKHTVGILTLGCKVNQYESEAIAEELERRGLSVLSHGEACDAYIINTCTVTAESDRKARQFIRRAINKNPNAYILVTGCLSQTDPQSVAEISGVDFICGNTDKLSVVDAVISLIEGKEKPSSPVVSVKEMDGAPFENMNIERFDRTRAYIKIEDGCESRCAYCIIPQARGKIRSRAREDVLREVCHFVRNGCREVVLTGIETASYGKDLNGYSLADLLCDIDKIEGDFTVRLGSLDPSSMNQSFTDKIRGLRHLAPHFHISMQSGSSKTLRNMRRKYNAEQALANVQRLKDAIEGVRFTTDMIVGFPGETEKDFEETLEFARRVGFLAIHVFPYSKRANTPAAELPDQIPQHIKKERSARLIKAQGEIRRAEFDRVLSEGRSVSVLFETFEDGIACGHTRDFLEVRVPSSRALHGEIFDVELTRHDGETFFGNILDKA